MKAEDYCIFLRLFRGENGHYNVYWFDYEI